MNHDKVIYGKKASIFKQSYKIGYDQYDIPVGSELCDDCTIRHEGKVVGNWYLRKFDDYDYQRKVIFPKKEISWYVEKLYDLRNNSPYIESSKVFRKFISEKYGDFSGQKIVFVEVPEGDKSSLRPDTRLSYLSFDPEGSWCYGHRMLDFFFPSDPDPLKLSKKVQNLNSYGKIVKDTFGIVQAYERHNNRVRRISLLLLTLENIINCSVPAFGSREAVDKGPFIFKCKDFIVLPGNNVKVYKIDDFKSIE